MKMQNLAENLWETINMEINTTNITTTTVRRPKECVNMKEFQMKPWTQFGTLGLGNCKESLSIKSSLI
jgi:hypothetical protein